LVIASVVLPSSSMANSALAVLHREHRRVAREGDVQRVGAVPVQDRRELVGAAQAACGALAELVRVVATSLTSDTCTPQWLTSAQWTRRDGG
jgi:hypothetical protein